MKSAFSFMILGLTLLPLAGFAQQEKMELGVGSGVLARTGKPTLGVNFKYQLPEGTIVPVQVEFGDGIQKYTAGIGMNFNTSEQVSLAVAFALGNINFDPKYDLENQQRKSIFTTLLRNELQVQLSRNLSLGLHADFDIINGIRVSQVKLNKNWPGKLNQTHTYAGTDANGTPMWYSNYTGEPFYADYPSKEAYDTALDNMKENQRKKSMTSFGVSLKIDIFAPKKNQ